MEIKIQIPKYSKDNGIEFVWEDNFTILAEKSTDSIVIKANKEGLQSLAKHLLTLAQNEVPVDTHLHYDDFNSLEDGSCEIVIQKI
ncbi:MULTISPECIES: Imm32 family immunity protein [Paenibacillus]|uniref:Uncharacterized protein n=2 Tax=Paenibacillus TaxID=44249 RepID=A0ABT4E5E0_9BACL|nr:hypothetical protein [Paenibacillus apiarius]MCY9517758.1 hypothetical protein [Paenibacillus apiarius]MCY9523456.1 hypothetical protein [Paenibacillus apiarius]MCY9554954.1 hypothetical protein [Paenibacillus apiarius]MCY9561552.1 hypothetical protein [Paenibacillus apiarius]MCY9682226.1 hypothetical protein [Paenibacillus apiarius]